MPSPPRRVRPSTTICGGCWTNNCRTKFPNDLKKIGGHPRSLCCDGLNIDGMSSRDRAAARLLSLQPGLLSQKRDQARSDAIAQLVMNAAQSLGFPATLEGRGIII